MRPAARPYNHFFSSLPFRHTFPFVIYGLFAAIVFLSVKNSFFWDNILVGSGYAHWYYITGFKQLFLPPEIDAGYQPLFGMLLAGTWKIFGHNLWSSHLLMLPFVLGIVHQLIAICRRFIPRPYLSYAAVLILADSTLLAQCTQVSPDVVLVFLYLFCLNKMLAKKYSWLAIGLIFLGMVSLRGTISVAALFFTGLWLETEQFQKLALKPFLKLILTFLPAVAVACGWLVLHYLHTGWFGYNPDPNWNWSTGAQFAGISGMVRNCAVIVWRLIDFGRLGIWLTAIVTAFLLYRNKQLFSLPLRQLTGMFGIPLFMYSIVSIPYANTIGHRYYIVVYLLFALCTFYLLIQISSSAYRRIGYAFMLVVLLSGNFWVYPDSVAKGWDSTLAHLPYFKLKREMLQFVAERNIPVSNIGSDFPNLYPVALSDLNNDRRQFKPKDLAADAYILYSNVFNGFSDEELSELKTRWKPVKRLEEGQVYMVLYQRPE